MSDTLSLVMMQNSNIPIHSILQQKISLILYKDKDLKYTQRFY